MPLKEKIRIDNIKKDKPLLRRAIKSLFYFIIGVAMSTGSVMDGLKPFGISIIAVSGKKYFPFSAAGSIVGYLIAGIDAQSARYIAAAVIATIGAFAAGAFDLNTRPYYSIAVSSAACLFSGLVLNFRLGAIGSDYLVTLGESVLCGGSAYFFHKALGANYKRLRFKALPLSDIACILISGMTVILNLSQLHIGVFYPVMALSVGVILSSVKYGGDRWGIILSLCFGFSFAITSKETLFIIGALTFSSMLAMLFSSLSSIGISVAYMCSIGFFAVAAGNEYALALFVNSLIGSVVFLLLPNAANEKLEELWDTGKNSPPDGSLRQNLVLKLRFASSAMAAISDSVDQVREKINDITRRENEKNKDKITPEEYVCREIVLEKTNQIRMVASDQFFSIADMLEDLAFEFDEAERFDSAASAKVRRLLGEYEIYPKNISVIEDKFGRIRVEILVDSGVTGIENPKLPTEIGKICSRYFQNGKITNFKNETMLSFSEKPNYRLSIGFAQHSAEGTLCGDTVKIINDNKGHSILIISDGMGKGSRAALDGAMGAGLISKLLNVGFGFDSALKVVNSALLVKSNDESLATLDIANIDLFTGKCEIYKAGAPASFIIKNSTVNKCELSSMPAGILRGIEFAKRTAVLSPSDSIVLFSDGITDLGDEWINKSLRLINGESPQKSADFLLSSALENSRGKKIDDMSVIIARMERN